MTEQPHYELWETDSRNCLADFASLSAALLSFAPMASRYGADSEELRSYVLVQTNAPGGHVVIGRGAALAELALEHRREWQEGGRA